MRAATLSIGLLVMFGATVPGAIAQQQCPAGQVMRVVQSPTGIVRPVFVPATASALRSGVVLRPGFGHRLTADGSIRVGVFGETGTPPEGWEPQGAAGQRFPAADAFTFSLLYRVGTNPWRMLARGPHLVQVGPTSPAGSEIIFGINDNKLDDNSGGFVVTITELALTERCEAAAPARTATPYLFKPGQPAGSRVSGTTLPCAGRTADGRAQSFQFPLYCGGSFSRHIPVEACTRAEALAEAQALARSQPPNCVLIP